MQTIATPVEGGYRVNGRKRWITNSVAGDIALLLCRTDDALKIGEIYEGANEIQRGAIARDIFGREITN